MPTRAASPSVPSAQGKAAEPGLGQRSRCLGGSHRPLRSDPPPARGPRDAASPPTRRGGGGESDPLPARLPQQSPPEAVAAAGHDGRCSPGAPRNSAGGNYSTRRSAGGEAVAAQGRCRLAFAGARLCGGGGAVPAPGGGPGPGPGPALAAGRRGRGAAPSEGLGLRLSGAREHRAAQAFLFPLRFTSRRAGGRERSVAGPGPVRLLAPPRASQKRERRASLPRGPGMCPQAAASAAGGRRAASRALGAHNVCRLLTRRAHGFYARDAGVAHRKNLGLLRKIICQVIAMLSGAG